jgi:hypothetical protein
MIHYSKLSKHPKNPRIVYDAMALMESIVTDGLKEALMICNKPKGDHYVLRGNRRLECIVDCVRVQHPERFEELFPEGMIPVDDKGQLSEKEQALLIVDHGNTRGLSGHAELYMAAKLLFAANLTERAVVAQMASLLNVATPIKSPKAIEAIRDLRKKLEDAQKVGDAEAIKVAAKALADRVFDARRGQIQLYKQLNELPKIVEASHIHRWTGDCKGFKKDDLNTKLTTKQVGQLYTAFLKDVENGFTKTKIGAEFTAVWREAKKKADGDPDSEPRTKALTSGQIKEPITKGQLESTAMTDVVRYHGGEKDGVASSVAEADKILAIVECVKDLDPTLWEQCSDLYEEEQAAKLAATLSDTSDIDPEGTDTEEEESN